jgi:hypothetical protein
MVLMLKRTDAQEADLQRLLQEQQDPASAKYHKWLDPEQYAARFGISAADMAKVTAWLQSQNFAIKYAARSRTFVFFSGTAAQIKDAFQTEIHHYKMDTEIHYAAVSEPRIPVALEPVVLGIRGMDDFYPKPAIKIQSGWGLVAGDIRVIYDTNFVAAPNHLLSLLGIDGIGQRVVVVGQTALGTSDINSYYSQYSQNGQGLNFIAVPGPDPGIDSNYVAEATLDVDIVAAVAPHATVYYVYSNSAFDAATYAIDNLIAPVVSMSFGRCETQTAAATAQGYRMLAQQANSSGITWLAGSGDAGAFACDQGLGETQATMGVAVNLPASIPEVTAVGGTELDYNLGLGCGGTSVLWYLNFSNQPNGTSTNCYIPEVAWNDTSPQQALSASGGGASTLFLAPAWQVGLAGVDTDYNGQFMRGVPDVAFAASTMLLPYEIVLNGAPAFMGGTSAATPVFAGIVVLLNQYLVETGLQAKPGLGNINPALYQLAKVAPTVFHDITSGNNKVPFVCTPVAGILCPPSPYGYEAAPGYDLVTGLGSVDAIALITAWPAIMSPPVLSAVTPNSAASKGAAFQLTVNGSGFASGAQVLWDNVALPTVFVSTTQLTASVAASLISSPGTAFISVSNGLYNSAPLPFSINTAAPSSPSVTVTTKLISNGVGYVNGSCATLPAVSTFTTTSPQAWVYFFVNGVNAGDQAQISFFRPDGALYTGPNLAASFTGSGCFAYYITISGFPPASYPGIWSVVVSWNHSATPLFTLNFALLSASSTVTNVLPQFAAGGSFVSDFYVVNTSSHTASFSINFYGDDGNPLSLPVLAESMLYAPVPARGAAFYEVGTPAGSAMSGSAVIVADPAITIQALFRRLGSDGSYYEAAVPASAGSNEVLVPFDATIFSGNGSQIYTGVAIANMDTSKIANVACTARDPQGNTIPGAISVPPLNPLGHWANYLFPALVGQRGTLDCVSNTEIGAVGIRALGTNAISSLPVIPLPETNASATGVVPQFAVGGSFVTDFYIVNSSSHSASASLTFYDDNGEYVGLPATILGMSVVTAVLSDSVPAGGAAFYEAGPPQGTSLSGSAMITSDPGVTVQALFRRLGSDGSYYEASVPSSTGSNEFIVPFDDTIFNGNGSQIYTGIAIANLSANPASVTCTARDSLGNTIPNAVSVPAMEPLGHWANYLIPALIGQRGTLDCMSTTKVGAIGIRALGTNAISSLPVILF